MEGFLVLETLLFLSNDNPPPSVIFFVIKKEHVLYNSFTNDWHFSAFALFGHCKQEFASVSTILFTILDIYIYGQKHFF